MIIVYLQGNNDQGIYKYVQTRLKDVISSKGPAFLYICFV